MEYTYPYYYKRFKCIANECEDTCCAGWQIVIDDNSMKKYSEYRGLFGNRLRNSIDFEEHSFYQYDSELGKKRCAFLNEDGLCDLYSEAGKDMLCRTCKRYPRHVEEYENLREISLSLSCPTAARLILGNMDKVHFITKQDSDSGYEEYEDFDYFMFTKLMDARNTMFSLIQDREVNIDKRIMAVLAFGHDLQRRVKSNKVFEIDGLINKYSCKNVYDSIYNKAKLISGNINEQQLFIKMNDVFCDLEVLNKNWKDSILGLVLHSNELYTDYSNIYSGCFSELEKEKVEFDIIIEQLMIYFIYTYFVGAVYDGRPYENIKLAVYSTLMIKNYILAYFVKYGKIEFSNVIRIAQGYAREVEHSDNNIEKLEKEFMHNGIFRINNFIKLLSI